MDVNLKVVFLINKIYSSYDCINIIKRLESATGLDITAPGFPAEMIDNEPEEPGYEVKVNKV